MSVNVGTKARFEVGGLLVGGKPSDGGLGAIGTSGTPQWIKSIRTLALGTITPGALGANAHFTTTKSFAGVKFGDIILAAPGADLGTHFTWSINVQAADTVRLDIQADGTGGTPTATTWTALWIQLV